jgi:hypothetical protein
MASITTWTRLEPHARAADMDASLAMRVHDPLWMLARQWQFGEYQGEDTGSPVWTAFSRVEMPIELYLPGPLDGHVAEDVQAYTPAVPLEFLVEAERTAAHAVMRANRRLAVEAGQQLLLLLPEALRTNYRTKLLQTFSVQPLEGSARAAPDLDMGSLTFLTLMAGRALDGSRLLDRLQQATPEQGATVLGFDAADLPVAALAITDWLDWVGRTIGPVGLPDSTRRAWNPERMEYACVLAAPLETAGDQVVLTAAEYAGGRLDWYSFDETAGHKLKHAMPGTHTRVEAGTIPTALSFRGMPANRLWEFEDAQVRFGAIQAAPTDLARMLLVEFLIAYGNDFFVVPIDLQTGALYTIDAVTITDTFGGEMALRPFADHQWRLFALSHDHGSNATLSSSTLFLPPVLGQHLASPPLEELHLLRDEMANLAWAVEHCVESQCGRPLNRNDAYQARRQHEGTNQPPAAEGTLTYRLDTWDASLPDYWIPLLPERPAPGQSAMQLVCYDLQAHSRGRLLAEHAPGVWLHLFDEEVPRIGAQLTRTQQYTRWYGGSSFSWIGREKRPGRGEGSSGLRYDLAEVSAVSPEPTQ